MYDSIYNLNTNLTYNVHTLKFFKVLTTESHLLLSFSYSSRNGSLVTRNIQVGTLRVSGPGITFPKQLEKTTKFLQSCFLQVDL